MTVLFNVENHINLLQDEVNACLESLAAYGMYYTVVVEGKLAVAKRDQYDLAIVGSFCAGAGTFEVFANEVAAMELVKWHKSLGQQAKVVRVDNVLSRYVGHIRAAVAALNGAIDL